MTAFAIVVGINHYGPLADLRPLHGAVADALDFADWLLDKDGGAVAPENLYLWTCPAPEPATTTQAVADYLANPTQWPVIGPDYSRPPNVGELIAGITQINRLAMEKAATRLYILFAGHGAQTRAQTIAEDPQNCFITGDFMKDAEGVGLINCDDMKRYLKNRGPREVIIFLDCCRNPLPLKVLRPSPGFGNVTASGDNFRIGVARAAQDECVAFEVPLGVPEPERGAFTQLLTYGLREVRDNGVLTFKELDKYVSEGLKEVVQKPNEQIPEFVEKPLPPDIVLTASPPQGKPARFRVALPGILAGSEVELRSASDELIATLIAVAKPALLELPRGAYSLEQDGIVLKAFNHVGPGTPDVIV